LEGNTKAAEQMYKATLTAFESARAQLKHENSRLPFAATANYIYDDYISLLVKEGKSEEALAVASQSRARTLAQGLGVAGNKASFQPATLNPRQIARQSGATLLFYWLGGEQSYLWVITPAKITLIKLPSQAEIVTHIKRYRQALLDLEDPLQTGNPDGQALYQILVAPAAKLIPPNSPVMILADSWLSPLNFETLLAPGPSPGISPKAGHNAEPAPAVHYWIEDATLLSAPSLAMLAAAQAAPLPPLVCPAGGPIGSVDLRVSSPRGAGEPLPLRTINRLEEGDTLLYRPVLRPGEQRKGEVTMVLVPRTRSPRGRRFSSWNLNQPASCSSGACPGASPWWPSFTAPPA